MPDLTPIVGPTPEEKAMVIDALETIEAKQVMMDVIKTESVDITLLPQASELSGTSLPILENGQLRVVPMSSLATSINQAIATAEAAAQEVAQNISDLTDAVADAQGAVASAVSAASTANAAAQAAQAAAQEIELVGSTGQSTTNAMTQKAVTDALNALDLKIVPQVFLTQEQYDALVASGQVQANTLYNIYE